MDTDKLNNRVAFLEDYITEQLPIERPRGLIFTASLIDILIFTLALNDKDKFLSWLPKIDSIFKDFDKGIMTEWDGIKFEYYRYLLSFIKEKPDLKILQGYFSHLECYMNNHYKLNTSDADLFINLVFVLFELGKDDKALELSKRIVEIKNFSVLSTIAEFFETKDDNKDPSKCVKKYKSFLKRQEKEPINQKYWYYSLYFRKMLKINALEPIIKGIVFGVND